MRQEATDPVQWGRLVADAHRFDLFAALEGVSGLLERSNPPPLVLVGALSLLMRGKINYIALWDLDLLFPDIEALNEFAANMSPAGVKVVRYDEEPMGTGEIRSMHTLWRADRMWINVDLMWRHGCYDLHTVFPDGFDPNDLWLPTPQEEKGRRFEIEMPAAHPWNVFVDKLTSPRLKRSLEEGDPMSVDLRHAASLLDNIAKAPGFWDYVRDRARGMGRMTVFEENLRGVRQAIPKMGYREPDIH